MHNDFETLVTASGLRYTTKESGSPFVGMGSSGATLSCIKCGHHKLRTRGAFKRYPSGLMFFVLTVNLKLAVDIVDHYRLSMGTSLALAHPAWTIRR